MNAIGLNSLVAMGVGTLIGIVSVSMYRYLVF